MIQVNAITVPSWLSNKAVFQQNVPFVIEGTAAPSATITLEISKDPTDGRKVSKLDQEYGVILSLETTTSDKGRFRFSIPAYKASTDTYTFVFKCFSNVVSFNDIRCGDVWVFLGNDFLCVPMKNANAPKTPLKRHVMTHLRFFSPSRDGLETDEEDIAYEPKTHYKEASWIKITDTKQLADVSSSAFSFAYTIADQVNYPIGVVDLSTPGSTILNWISDEVYENQTALHDYIDELGLTTDEDRYKGLIKRDRQIRREESLRQDVTKGRQNLDFDLTKEREYSAILGEKTASENIAAVADLDFPGSSGSSFNSKIVPEAGSEPGSTTKNLDFDMISNMQDKTGKKIDDSKYIKKKFRLSTLYRCKLAALSGLTIRGMCFSPEADEQMFGRYDLLLMGLLGTLSQTFEPKEVYDDNLMPSFLFVAMHPKCVDKDFPYKVLEFNEDVREFTGKLNMPSGIISLHDLLLPDKTKTFTLGVRLAVIALGLHVTPKMPKSCPECIGVEKTGNKLILEFDNLADGLRLAEGQTELRGFTVCGENRIFQPAKARILHGVRVMVWADDIEEPVSVTYGFSPFPHDATFKNLNDLPVMPFRFDRLPAYYAPGLFFASCDDLELIGMRDWGEDFEVLKVFRTFKGNGVISADNMNKSEGNASLHIRYETENSLYGFEPNLDYVSLMGPVIIRGKNKIMIDVFNPDTVKKELRVEGFGTAEIRQSLNWQTLEIKWAGEGDITLETLKFTVADTSKNGEIYIDNIRFL
ncbi:MAG: hypothetical protein J6127_01610 [Clostridiales bacterium]|nr:hypothetical protein [Clostridiales bacterium]